MNLKKNFSQKIVDNAHCLAVSSRTTALHLALLSIDISSKDEVIISALTFVADINVVKMVAAKPVLADC